jgi:hypothetical protein
VFEVFVWFVGGRDVGIYLREIEGRIGGKKGPLSGKGIGRIYLSCTEMRLG